MSKIAIIVPVALLLELVFFCIVFAVSFHCDSGKMYTSFLHIHPLFSINGVRTAFCKILNIDGWTNEYEGTVTLILIDSQQRI